MKARATIEFYDDDFNLVKKHNTELVDLKPGYSTDVLDVYTYKVEVNYADIRKPIHKISDISEVHL